MQRLDLPQPRAGVVQHDPLEAARDRRPDRDRRRIRRRDPIGHRRLGRGRGTGAEGAHELRDLSRLCRAVLLEQAGDPLEARAVKSLSFDLQLPEALHHPPTAEDRHPVVDQLGHLGPLAVAQPA
jgi:hypothetical protein